MLKRVVMAVVTLSFALASSARAEGKEAIFSAPKDKVFDVALEVIAREWRVEQANKDTGIISFRSGMSMSSWKGQDLSLLVVGTDSGTKVLANSEKRGSQAVTWGEGGKLQKKAIRLIGERLLKDGLIPESEVPKK